MADAATRCRFLAQSRLAVWRAATCRCAQAMKKGGAGTPPPMGRLDEADKGSTTVVGMDILPVPGKNIRTDELSHWNRKGDRSTS